MGSSSKTEVMFEDVEKFAGNDFGLLNSKLGSVAWKDVSVSVKDKKGRSRTSILSEASGICHKGEVMAVMGPSGCGKTTLLQALASQKESVPSSLLQGQILFDGKEQPLSTIRQISRFVEQEEALIGSLSVAETLTFAARLALPSSLPRHEINRRVDDLIQSFGLQNSRATLIGTPIRKGISGGQKRRVVVASQLITAPKVLFLDEPTSGLDSTASFEVISYIKSVAKKYNLIVIASIHQPSTATFALFDKVLLLSGGKTCYFGSVATLPPYFGSIELPVPQMTNPAEFILDVANVDFAGHNKEQSDRLERVQNLWSTSSNKKSLESDIEALSEGSVPQASLVEASQRANPLFIPLTLLHRSFIKSYRDVIAYGIRIAMYTGLAIMMGTVWLRLDTNQQSIQPFINAIFFGSAFMSFMAVAYVPAFLEDRATFIKERANGLYGPLSFMLSNFIIGIPYLFLITVIFSVIAYWLGNFEPTAQAFFTWIMWVFLDLLAAESLVVLLTSIFPNFVVSLALIAFANGLWMSVGGFLVNPTILNVFWRYWAHDIDYQTYVFQGMMVNEFQHRSYDCGRGCQCMYQSELAPQCKIAGTAVLREYGYRTGRMGEWAGILIAIIFVYRMLALGVTYLRKT